MSHKNVTNVVRYILVQLSSLIKKIPSTNSQITNNIQIWIFNDSNILEFYSLEFEIYLKFGAWTLEFKRIYIWKWRFPLKYTSGI